MSLRLVAPLPAPEPVRVLLPPSLEARLERVLASNNHGPGSRRLVEIAILMRGLEALEKDHSTR